jgi:hypothetical protein
MFYVYEHWRSDLNTCFYVGKGSGDRAYKFQTNRNRFYRNVVAKLRRRGLCPIVRFVITEIDDELEAYVLEVEQVALRREQGYLLVNLTEGGGGVRGVVLSADTRQKISEKLKGIIWITDEILTRQLLPGEKMPEGWRLGRPTGRVASIDTRLKMSTSHKGMVWITDGSRKRRLREDEEMPDSWRLGQGPNNGRAGGLRTAELGVSIFHQEAICPHCGKKGKLAPLKRWHFDNCPKRDREVV